MAIKDSYPAIRPSLDLNFAGSRMVDPRITFTRASTATYFDDKGVMLTAPAGVPRINFDQATLECNGLLIEEQRTNLLTYSERFDNAAWAKKSVTVTANAAVTPDGTLSADKIIEDTVNSEHHVRSQGISCAAGTYTMSVFWHESSDRSPYLRVVHIGDTNDTSEVLFSKASLSLNQVSGNAVSASATNVGKGWWCIALVFSILATRTVQYGVQLWSTTSVYTGNGTSGIYIWGAQLEAGTFPTSYIKTEASQVTRAADNAVMTGTNFSDWYRQDEGTVVADYSCFSAQSNSCPWGLSDGTVSNYLVEALVLASTPYSRIISSNAGVTQINENFQATNFSMVRTVVGYSLNNTGMAQYGVLRPIDITFNPPTVDRLKIGGSGYFSDRFCGHIKRFSYYPRRLSDTNLQALSA